MAAGPLIFSEASEVLFTYLRLARTDTFTASTPLFPREVVVRGVLAARPRAVWGWGGVQFFGGDAVVPVVLGQGEYDSQLDPAKRARIKLVEPP